jgi:C1A family cysteine protease
MLNRILLWYYKLKGRNHIRPELDGCSLGALKDKPDERDYSVGLVGGVDIPSKIDLREFVPEVKSQGRLNSCVSHAICSAIELQINMKDPARYVALSELYNYYYGRIESGLWPQDNGMYPRDAIKAAKKYGIALEIAHPYNPIKYNELPCSAARSVASIYGALIKDYFRVFSDTSMKEKLALGFPIIISVPTYSYWNYPIVVRESKVLTKPAGIIRLPIPGDELQGFHALCCLGYDDHGWICLNSWSKSYGDKGFYYLPYGYEIIDRWVLVVV